MLKRHFAIVNFIRISLDVLVIGILWNSVYFFRFYSGLFSYSEIPPCSKHLLLTLPVVVILCLCRHWMGVYQSLRIESTLRQLDRQIRSIVVGYLFVVLFLYYSQEVPYTRVLLLLFLVALFTGLLATHFSLVQTLRYLRSKGYNQRHYAIIGTGKHAIKLLDDIQKHSYFGLRCSFIIDDKPHLDGKTINGIRIYGNIEDLTALAVEKGVDEIYLASNGPRNASLYSALNELQSRGMTLRIQPEWGQLASITRPSVVTVGSSILFTAAESPLTGMNIIFKDVFDRTAALFLLCLFSVPMVLIALLVKLTSKGPIFYRQVRIGMDNRPFEMLKFRTMLVSREPMPGWTVQNDPRRTAVGRLLRTLSLDELPQLLNVLKGQMSLVGPRPEQPRFVKKFGTDYKKYMFRHKVKAGMTGWAQIHGFRGDTSLRKRVLYDLYYVRNWSVWLDLLILVRTPFCILSRKNAY